MNPMKLLQDILTNLAPGERKIPQGQGGDLFGPELSLAEEEFASIGGKQEEVPMGLLAALQVGKNVPPLVDLSGGVEGELLSQRHGTRGNGPGLRGTSFGKGPALSTDAAGARAFPSQVSGQHPGKAEGKDPFGKAARSAADLAGGRGPAGEGTDPLGGTTRLAADLVGGKGSLGSAARLAAGLATGSGEAAVAPTGQVQRHPQPGLAGAEPGAGPADGDKIASLEALIGTRARVGAGVQLGIGARIGMAAPVVTGENVGGAALVGGGARLAATGLAPRVRGERLPPELAPQAFEAIAARDAMKPDAVRLDRATGTVQIKLPGGAEEIPLPTPALTTPSSLQRRDARAPAPQQEVAKQEIRQVEPQAARAEQEGNPVAHGHGTVHGREPSVEAAEVPVAPMAPTFQDEPFDPTLQLRFTPGGARIAMQTQGSGELTVQLDVREGVADLKVGGQAAWLVGAHTDELRVALAQEGLTLGKLDQKDAQGFGPGGDRPSTNQGQGDDGSESTGRPSSETPSTPRQVARRTGSGRHHVEA